MRLARSCAEWGDIVIENMRPGVIDRLGLGYEALKTRQSRRDHAVHLQHGADRTACRHARLRIAAHRARRHVRPDRRNATARRCCCTGPTSTSSPRPWARPRCSRRWSSGSARETAPTSMFRSTSAGLLFLAGPLLDYHATGRIAERAGTTIRRPHRTAPTLRSDGWIALSCWSDGEFVRRSPRDRPARMVARCPSSHARRPQGRGRRNRRGTGAWTRGRAAPRRPRCCRGRRARPRGQFRRRPVSAIRSSCRGGTGAGAVTR